MNYVIKTDKLVLSGGVVEGYVSVRDGRIAEVSRTPITAGNGANVVDCSGLFVAPGMMDTHIHGLHGFDTANNNVDDILGMSDALLQYGVTSFCPTIYTNLEPLFVDGIRAVATAQGQETGSRIHGMHLEGPFISKSKAGAQPPEAIRETVDTGLLETIHRFAKGKVAIMTAAPETNNIGVLVDFCRGEGIRLSAGHTNATHEEMCCGADMGFSRVTHLFNAMPSINHRAPGAVVAALMDDRLYCELIADGKHVNRAVAELALRCKPSDKVILITDALCPTGLTGGNLFANGKAVEMRDSLWHHVEDGTIAGSSLDMLTGVKNLWQWGVDMPTAFQYAAQNPYANLGVADRGALAVGNHADIIVFDEQFDLKATIVGGDLKYTGKGFSLPL